MKKVLILLLVAFAGFVKAQDFSGLNNKADYGDPIAQRDLALKYLYGRDTEKNVDKAIEYYQKAALCGSTHAMMSLCDIYSDKGMYSDATSYCRKLLDYGHAKSAFNIGICFSHGLGTVQDEEKAKEYYALGASMGDADCMNLLASMEKTKSNAIRYYKTAARLENPIAQYNYGAYLAMGIGTSPNYVKALYWITSAIENGYQIKSDKFTVILNEFKKQASNGNIDAKYVVGCCLMKIDAAKAQEYINEALENATPNVLAIHALFNKDSPKCIEWLTKSAEAGNAFAQNELGVRYLDGNGVRKDNKTAFELFKKSAAQNYPDGMFNLAMRYKNGEGTVQNIPLYVEYLQRLVTMQYANAIYFLGDYYYQKQNYAEAVKLFQKSVSVGLLQALAYLGECYYYGRGVKQNYITAAELFEDNLRTSHPMGTSANCLSKIYRFGYGKVTKNVTYADELLKKAASFNDANALKAIEAVSRLKSFKQ